jgi:protoheme IX farnesyltransferase
MTARDLLALTKFTISAFSALSAAAGYVAAGPALLGGLPVAAGGTLLLAMGASALNEILERDLDARMNRTLHRPLARGALSPGTALLLASAFCAAGAALLGLLAGWVPALLGLGAVAWYALAYTPLKRRSAFAVVPGAIIGALPPAVGWTAAGGDLLDPALHAIALVFFLWQVPHFWLLALLHRHDYARAGLPTLSARLSRSAAHRLTFAWVCATAAACALLPASGAVARPVSLALLATGALLWVIRSAALLRRGQWPGAYRRAFGETNLFILEVMAALAIG